MQDGGNSSSQNAVFGGGCFWCLEALYDMVKGVSDVVSGYAGGQTENPTYEQMHTGLTGHAEVVQITFNPQEVTYRELLEIFFAMHDPTTLNRQGNDVGPQYRSIILYTNEEQRETAEDMVQHFAPTLWDDPIVTEVKSLTEFWPAEAYHQQFYEKNPQVGYCQMIINPKVSKFRQNFVSKLKQ